MIAQRDGEVATPEIARPRVPHEVNIKQVLLLTQYTCNYLMQIIYRYCLLSEVGVVDLQLRLLKLTTQELTDGLKYVLLLGILEA